MIDWIREGKRKWGVGVRMIQSFLFHNQVDGDVINAGTRVGRVTHSISGVL